MPAQPSLPTGGVTRHAASTSTRPPQNASPRVVYRKDDEVARGLAERTVALAPAGAGLRAAGLDAAEFAAAVTGGLEQGLCRWTSAPITRTVSRRVHGSPPEHGSSR